MEHELPIEGEGMGYGSWDKDGREGVVEGRLRRVSCLPHSG